MSVSNSRERERDYKLNMAAEVLCCFLHHLHSVGRRTTTSDADGSQQNGIYLIRKASSFRGNLPSATGSGECSVICFNNTPYRQINLTDLLKKKKK